MLDINLRGPFLCARYAIPHIAAAGGGAVIFTASELALVGSPGSPAYCASKAGLIGMARAMALDHAPQGIRVNCLCPGATDTPMLRRSFERADDPAADEADVVRRMPLGRLGTVDELARAALFLASDDASFVTGTALVVDGGWMRVGAPASAPPRRGEGLRQGALPAILHDSLWELGFRCNPQGRPRQMKERIPVTREGLAQLQAEYDELVKVRRPQIITAVAEARSEGDLRENAGYHAAKNDQGFIEGRIRDLELMFKLVDIIDETPAAAKGGVKAVGLGRLCHSRD